MLVNASNIEMQRIASMKDTTEQNRALESWVRANQQINEIDARYLQQYLVGVLEDVHTTVEKFRESAEHLVGLTRVLEYLTRVLIALTLLLVIQPLLVQVVTVWGLPFVAIGFILLTLKLTQYFRKDESKPRTSKQSNE